MFTDYFAHNKRKHLVFIIFLLVFGRAVFAVCSYYHQPNHTLSLTVCQSGSQWVSVSVSKTKHGTRLFDHPKQMATFPEIQDFKVQVQSKCVFKVILTNMKWSIKAFTALLNTLILYTTIILFYIFVSIPFTSDTGNTISSQSLNKFHFETKIIASADVWWIYGV